MRACVLYECVRTNERACGSGPLVVRAAQCFSDVRVHESAFSPPPPPSSLAS